MTEIIGEGLLGAANRAAQLAEKDIPILISGATGTGKELVAYAYAKAWRKQQSYPLEEKYAMLNCTGKPDDVSLGDLFGVQKGAFTGAVAARQGFIHRYKLICLDELGDAGPRFQSAILRVVEYGEYSRLGSNKVEKIDTRLIASTNKLAGIRRDLAYRFSIVEVPGLVRRPDDITALILHFAKQYHITAVTKRFIVWAGAHTWPGNVRELRACVQQAAAASILDIPRRIPLGRHRRVRGYQELLLERIRVAGKTVVPMAQLVEELRKARDPKMIRMQLEDDDQVNARREMDVNFFLEQIAESLRHIESRQSFAHLAGPPARSLPVAPTTFESEQETARALLRKHGGNVTAAAPEAGYTSESGYRQHLRKINMDVKKEFPAQRRRHPKPW